MASRIVKVVSGGQTGVDRTALNVALELGMADYFLTVPDGTMRILAGGGRRR